VRDAVYYSYVGSDMQTWASLCSDRTSAGLDTFLEIFDSSCVVNVTSDDNGLYFF